jgi:CelD/BcsL family acetyltransferase involved in cellulose biosynthesis
MVELSPLNVVISRGAEAVARLRDREFQTQWHELHRECAWATVFQSSLFVLPWVDVYGSTWDVAIIEGTRSQTLVSLLLLASPAGGAWGHLGGGHAEYHAWLARDESPVLLRSLLDASRKSLGFTELRWLFLPPGAPAHLLRATSPTCSLRAQPQPCRFFADAAAPGSSLRSKRSRLRKRGTLVLDRPDTVDARLRFLDEFIPLHDARHEAIGHGRAFDADPLKRAFYRTALASAELLDVAGLRLDGALIAGHIGVRSGSSVVLGMIAHDSRYASESPGQVLLHELSEALALGGLQMFDLTPGGAYKDRFATTNREAWAADQAWGLVARARLALRYGPIARMARRIRTRLTQQAL